jgi:hypothetical protein
VCYLPAALLFLILQSLPEILQVLMQQVHTPAAAFGQASDPSSWWFYVLSVGIFHV